MVSEFCDFVGHLVQVSLPDVFNPYRDECDIHDRPGAPALRADLLNRTMRAAEKLEIDSLWIGRDLGYRGGRRTGIALTDEVHADRFARRWGLEFLRATKGRACAERTASAIWQTLSQIERPIFLWNAFPFHPFSPEDPMSNRPHNRTEARIGEEILSSLCEFLRPSRIVAIGNDAARVATRISTSSRVVKVRHPSYGGKAQFTREMGVLYGLSTRGVHVARESF